MSEMTASDFLRNDLPVYDEQLLQLESQKREVLQKLAELQNFCKQLDQNIEAVKKRISDVEEILNREST